jgi:hypothetical protein
VAHPPHFNQQLAIAKIHQTLIKKSAHEGCFSHVASINTSEAQMLRQLGERKYDSKTMGELEGSGFSRASGVSQQP